MGFAGSVPVTIPISATGAKDARDAGMNEGAKEFPPLWQWENLRPDVERTPHPVQPFKVHADGFEWGPFKVVRVPGADREPCVEITVGHPPFEKLYSLIATADGMMVQLYERGLGGSMLPVASVRRRRPGNGGRDV